MYGIGMSGSDSFGIWMNAITPAMTVTARAAMTSRVFLTAQVMIPVMHVLQPTRI